MPKARYVLIGGFLGAGKTTAIVKLAVYLAGRGLRAGLITNDQSVDLVDTARVRAAGFPVEEITGGCFCCKFNSLREASQQLTRQSAPDVLIAEPVGSCTDLKATVSYPLRQLYGDDYEVAPLSVLVDPVRCARVLGLESGRSFSEKVLYVYRKQLEEAEILVINKVDLLPPDSPARARLAGAVRKNFPQARIFEVSCTTGEGLKEWFDAVLTGKLGHRPAMQVDYDVYADGEAMLGWLNATAHLSAVGLAPSPAASRAGGNLGEGRGEGSSAPVDGGAGVPPAILPSAPAPGSFDGNGFLLDLARRLRERLSNQGVGIAHLKMTLAPSEGPDLGAVSLTRTELEPQATHRLQEPLSEGELMVNLRAEADPALLEAQVRAALADISAAVSAAAPLAVELRTVNAFRPGRPNPTHRMAGPAK